MRQVILDTETTGLEPEQGHRVIEVGAVEIVDRRLTGKRLQLYINPHREIDDAAFEIHGLDAEFLADKPAFADVAGRFLDFVKDAEVIIHNAPFDVSFIDYELSLLGDGDGEVSRYAERRARRMADICQVMDSLALARRKHPGQKNSLDALCRRYDIDNSVRELHGALLDAEILADVYLAMTGGQMSVFGDDDANRGLEAEEDVILLPEDRPRLLVLVATAEELAVHEAHLDELDADANDGALWRRRAAQPAVAA